MISKISFSKTTRYTRLTIESNENVYSIRVDNATGEEIVYEKNNKVVESFQPQTILTRELMQCWNMFKWNIINFAVMPLAEFKSKLYVDRFHNIRHLIEKFNSGGFNRS